MRVLLPFLHWGGQTKLWYLTSQFSFISNKGLVCQVLLVSVQCLFFDPMQHKANNCLSSCVPDKRV